MDQPDGGILIPSVVSVMVTSSLSQGSFQKVWIFFNIHGEIKGLRLFYGLRLRPAYEYDNSTPRSSQQKTGSALFPVCANNLLTPFESTR